MKKESEDKKKLAKKTIKLFPTPPIRSIVSIHFLRILRHIFQCLWRLKVEGLDNLPSTGNCILCPNHESHLDSLFVLSCLPYHYQVNLCSFAKREHFEHLLPRMGAWFMRSIPVNREGNPRRVLETGIELLKAGRPLLIHPEGTRTRDGKLNPFQRGAARLAVKTGLPLVPIRISGAYNIYRAHTMFPKLLSFDSSKPLRLSIKIGKPIFPPPDKKNVKIERSLIAKLRQEVINLGKSNTDRNVEIKNREI